MDVRALVGHDPIRVLARVSAGTLRLSADARGLFAEIDIDPATSYAEDAVTSVRRGDVKGWSYAFRVPSGGDEWILDGGVPTRRVHSALISETTLTAFPAYPATESARAVGDLERRPVVGGERPGAGGWLSLCALEVRLLAFKHPPGTAFTFQANLRGRPELAEARRPGDALTPKKNWGSASPIRRGASVAQLARDLEAKKARWGIGRRPVSDLGEKLATLERLVAGWR